jgi:hypothetical protein
MAVANGAFTRTTGFAPENDRIVPRFFIESIPDELASQREGRAIFHDQERVELMIPGVSQYNIKVDIVSDEHRRRWPDQYKAFRAGQEISAEGTPLEQWPILKRSQVLELKAMNFVTVEQVSQMDDQTMQRFMGGRRLRELARAYIDDAEAGALLSQVTAENAKKDGQIAELTRKVEELSTLLGSIHGEMQNMKNAPHPSATAVPYTFDPAEQMKQNPTQESAAASSLDDLPPPRKGRRPLPRDAAGNIIRDKQVA